MFQNGFQRKHQLDDARIFIVFLDFLTVTSSMAIHHPKWKQPNAFPPQKIHESNDKNLVI